MDKGRSSDLGSLMLHAFPVCTSGLSWNISPLQWRDRAGLQPASLL